MSGKWLVSAVLVAVAANSVVLGGEVFGPKSWPVVTACAYLLVVVQQGWANLGRDMAAQVILGVCSSAAFMHFLEVVQPEFSGWGDVYFFCGHDFRFCTCALTWNVLGWYKALVLADFVLCAAGAARALAIYTFLGGLLPGEDSVFSEAVFASAFRLVPYWLNNWERRWGAECTSVLFELPHFAFDLWVVLPLAQLAFGRLVSLFSPHIRVPAPIAASLARRRIALRPPDPPAPKAPTATDFLALDPVRGVWTLDERQRRLWPRLRANTRFLAFLAFLGAAALTNTLLTPRLLGRATLAHPRAALAAAFTAEPTLTQAALAPQDVWLGQGLALQLAAAHVPSVAPPAMPPLPRGAPAEPPTSAAPGHLLAALSHRNTFLYSAAARALPCASPRRHRPRAQHAPWRRFARAARQHARELRHLRHPRRPRLTTAAAVTVLVMRLSYEGLFVAAAAYAAYLLRRPAAPLAALVRAASAASYALQCAVLYLFPAACWAWGAGAPFAALVSALFWGAPALLLFDEVCARAVVVLPRRMWRANGAVLERMAAQCPICWSALDTGKPGRGAGAPKDAAGGASRAEQASADADAGAAAPQGAASAGSSSAAAPSHSGDGVVSASATLHQSSERTKDAPGAQHDTVEPPTSRARSGDVSNADMQRDGSGVAVGEAGPLLRTAPPAASNPAHSTLAKRAEAYMTAGQRGAGEEPGPSDVGEPAVAPEAPPPSLRRRVGRWLSRKKRSAATAAESPVESAAEDQADTPTKRQRTDSSADGTGAPALQKLASFPLPLSPVSSPEPSPRRRHIFVQRSPRPDSPAAEAAANAPAESAEVRTTAALAPEGTADTHVQQNAGGVEMAVVGRGTDHLHEEWSRFVMDEQRQAAAAGAPERHAGEPAAVPSLRVPAEAGGNPETVQEAAQSPRSEAASSHSDSASSDGGAAPGPDGAAPLVTARCVDATPVTLACGHAFHFACTTEWLHQCKFEARPPACPVCQAKVDVRTQFLPRRLLQRRRPRGSSAPGEDGDAVAAANDGHHGAAPPQDHIAIDFLAGRMPRADVLHLASHPYGPRQTIATPFVSHWTDGGRRVPGDAA